MFQSITAALATGLSFIQVVRQLLPEVIALVGDVQTAFPASTSVAEKAAHVETVLRQALAVTQCLPVTVDQIVPALLTIATAHLTALNVAPAAPATVAGA